MSSREEIRDERKREEINRDLVVDMFKVKPNFLEVDFMDFVDFFVFVFIVIFSRLCTIY
jgi:hypothetical protein